MPGRFVDWVRGLTAKTTTIDGTEQVHLDSSGLSQKALLSDVIRYGGGNSTRVTTIGNANIHQKSDGTMWLEVTGQTAGNARGAGAFDWQATRDSAAKVASGANAVAIGYRCTASGDQSVAIGKNNTASGAQSFASGSSCTASGTGSTSFGEVNTSSGGGSNTFGNGNTASARYANAFGTGLLCVNYGQSAFGVGDAVGTQNSINGMYDTTADASAKVLKISPILTGAEAQFNIAAKRAVTITGLVTAMSDATDGYKVKAWEIKCIITRDNSNNTRIVGTPIITVLGNDADAAGWAITSITADDTNECLAITVTGEAATNIKWQASLFYGQVGY